MSTRRRATWAEAAAALLAGLWVVPAVFLDGWLRGALTTTALTGLITLAAACAWFRGRGKQGRTRWGWRLLALSSGLWATGEAIWAAYAWRDVPLAVPSPADPFFALAGPTLLVGVALLALHQAARGGRLLVTLDTSILVLSVLLTIWLFIAAASNPATATLAGTVSNAFYLTTDVTALLVGSLVLSRCVQAGSAAWRGPLPALAVAVLSTGVGDMAYSYALLQGTYHLGHPAETAYVLRGVALVGVALMAREGVGRVDGVPGRVAVLAPYAALVLGVGSVLWRAAVGDITNTTLLGVTLLAVLVISRQIGTVLKHNALLRELDARVTARTEQLAQQEVWFRTVLQHSSDVVTVVDVEGTVLWQSSSGEQQRRSYEAGTSLVEELPSNVATGLRRILDELAQGDGAPSRRVSWSRPADGAGDERHFETQVRSLLHDPAVNAIVLTTRDVTERAVLQGELSHRAFHDALTGLANRNLYRDRLDHALAARGRDGQMVAVLFLDLDGFKAVNDTLGHEAGDALLREVSTRLSSAVRPGDTVARLGGDEFAVLLERVANVDEVSAIATRILTGLRPPMSLGGKAVPLQGSLGYAVTETGTETGEELLRNADLAMYAAKSGRTGAPQPFLPEMHEALLLRVRTEEGLRDAIARGELRVHYQPTVDLATGDVTGVEALVRWQRSDGTLVPPLEFIPIAEESGLIVPIGAWVLRESCLQGARWLTDGERPLTVSVNVSGRQLTPALLDTVRETLAETGFPAHLLVLELTESILVGDGAAAVGLLHELKQLGVRLAIDDFGTGYSSLSYLSRLPVDVIKVDRKFVNDLTAAGERSELARTIIEMARALRLSTTAEGIENDRQLDELQRLGCELGQGFLFSRPVPADQLASLLPGRHTSAA